MYRAGIAVLLMVTSLQAFGEFADYVFVPPAKEPMDAVAPDLAGQAQVWAAQPQLHYVFDNLAGANELLKVQHAEEVPPRIADGYAVELSSEALFESGAQEAQWTVYAVRITSVDATAIRLLTDLSGLAADDEVWVLTPSGEQAFGPYTLADATEDGRWLPTVAGDTVVLAVRTAGTNWPDITVTALSHFFIEPAKALYPCPVEADCVSTTAYREVSTGVGLLIIPFGTFSQAQCSGALLNNPDTAERENYLLSAHHCFPDSAKFADMEVFWDYRAVACDGSGVPDMNTVPRSEGAQNLEESTTFDGQLLLLNNVPIGARGRAWLGWDTRDPVKDDRIAGAHYPAGKPLKACFGTVTEVNVDTFLGDDQTEVHWDEGITEQGSSGSPLMYQDINFRVFGMLSNGPEHDCNNPPQNRDNFSAFRRFFPQVQCHLLGDRECQNEPWSPRSCFAKAALGDTAPQLSALRAVRDQWLLHSALGRRAVRGYYAASETLAGWLADSPNARRVFLASAAPFIRMGRALL